MGRLAADPPNVRHGLTWGWSGIESLLAASHDPTPVEAQFAIALFFAGLVVSFGAYFLHEFRGRFARPYLGQAFGLGIALAAVGWLMGLGWLALLLGAMAGLIGVIPFRAYHGFHVEMRARRLARRSMGARDD